MKPKIIFSEEKKNWVKRPLLSNIEKILDYRGRTPKKLGLSWSDTGYLALSALNVKNGYIDFKVAANYGDQELYERWMGDNHLHKGQVVFTTEAPMGNVAQIPNDDLYILSQRTIAFEVKRDLIREDFLATLLRSQKIFNELTSLSSGGTAKGVSQKSLSNLKVCLPTSLEEQSAIGSLFRTFDDLLASYKDNLANYQSLKTTMLSKMFPKAGQSVPEIRLDGFEGKCWEEKKLIDLVSPVSRKVRKPSVPYYRMSIRSHAKGTFKQYVDDPKKIAMDNLFKVKENDLVVNITFAWEHAIAIAKKEDDGLLVSHRFPTFLIDKSDKDFINIYIKREEFRQNMELLSPGGAGRNRVLNVKDFIKIQMIVPELREQLAIGAYFSTLDNIIHSHQEKISQLETLKKKLLQDMFI